MRTPYERLLKARILWPLGMSNTSITLTAQGEMTQKAKTKISMESASLEEKGNSQVSIEGAGVAVKANGTLDLQAAGTTTVKGAMVNIN